MRTINTLARINRVIEKIFNFTVLLFCLYCVVIFVYSMSEIIVYMTMPNTAIFWGAAVLLFIWVVLGFTHWVIDEIIYRKTKNLKFFV